MPAEAKEPKDKQKEFHLDALAAMKSNPERLIAAIQPREAVIVSILAESGTVMLVDTIRDRWIDRIFANMAYNIEAMRKAWCLMKLLAGKDIGEVPEPVRTPFLWLDHLDIATKSKGVVIADVFHRFAPDSRKVPLLIGGPTIQSFLENTMSTFGGMVASRPVADARAKRGYYLDPEFYCAWKANAEALARKIAENPFRVTYRDGLQLYGLENAASKARLEAVKRYLERAEAAKKDAKKLRAIDGELREATEVRSPPEEHSIGFHDLLTDFSEVIIINPATMDIAAQKDFLEKMRKTMKEDGVGAIG